MRSRVSDVKQITKLTASASGKFRAGMIKIITEQEALKQIASTGMSPIIATHNGIRNADEAFAVAMLHKIKPAFTVVCTRDPKVILGCQIVVDVGGEFAPEHGRFDHHQFTKKDWDENNRNSRRENGGVPYAAFGLVWNFAPGEVLDYIDAVLAHAPLKYEVGEKERFVALAGIAMRVDKILVESVDANDTGYRDPAEGVYSVSRMIGALNPTWMHRLTYTNEVAFAHMVELAGNILASAVIRAAGDEKAVSVVETLIAAHWGDHHRQILVMESYVPWQEAVEGHDTLLVVYPDTTGQWRVQVVPEKPGSFVPRIPLPESWAALRDAEFAKHTGVADAVFCHAKCFIAGARSKAGALELAHMALASAGLLEIAGGARRADGLPGYAHATMDAGGAR